MVFLNSDELVPTDILFEAVLIKKRPPTLANKTPLQFLKDHGIIHDYKPLSFSHM